MREKWLFFKLCALESYLNISDNAFDIGRSLVQLLLMRLEIFPEVGRIYKAIGKLKWEQPHSLGGVPADGRGGSGHLHHLRFLRWQLTKSERTNTFQYNTHIINHN